MEASLQHKLQQLDVPPPPAVWDKIAAVLDSDNLAADGRLSLKMDNAQIAPPADVWNKIDAQLHQADNEATPVIRPSFQWKKLAVAAIFIAVVGIVAAYLLNNNTPEQPKVAQTLPKKKVNLPATSTDTQKIAEAPVVNISPEATEHTEQKATRKKRTPKPEPSYASNESDASAENTITDEAVSSPAEAPLYELTTVSALQPVSVSAPPIRDKKGDLILDLSTIRNGNNDYITVTGPNGKQTKMSTKFLSCIGYINSNSPGELDSRAQRCKLQFEEWRNRLLSEPGFIPTANNFFDIFELKDLLEEM